jgi:hypothetical protein
MHEPQPSQKCRLPVPPVLSRGGWSVGFALAFSIIYLVTGMRYDQLSIRFCVS